MNECSTLYFITTEYMTCYELEKALKKLVEEGSSGEIPNDLVEDFTDEVDLMEIGKDYSDKECFVIHTLTAWDPDIECIKTVMDYYDPEAIIQYSAVEPGEGLFETNIPEFYGLVAVDAASDSLFDYFELGEPYTWDEVKAFIKEEYPDIYKSKMTMEEANIELHKNHVEATIYEWQIVDLDERIEAERSGDFI